MSREENILGLQQHLKEHKSAAFLTLMEQGTHIDEIIAQLPPHLQTFLSSDDFQKQCNKWFNELDTDLSGSLEIEELTPVSGKCGVDFS